MLLALDGLSLAWSWFTTEAAESTLGAAQLHLDVATRALVFCVAGAGCLVLDRRTRVAGRRALRAVRGGWRAHTPLGRAACVLGLALAAWSVGDYAWAPADGHGRRLRSARARVPGLHVNAQNRHVPVLLEALLRDETAGPVVVDVDDEDPRANQASYYAYPRLLVMEPELRRWSLRSRQYHLGGVDARGRAAPPRPDPAAGPDYARARELPLLRVASRRDEESDAQGFVAELER